MHKQLGFTLIELVVTVVIVAALLLTSASLTNSWIDRSQVASAKANFETALLQAKTLALRNHNNQPFSEPAVSLCVDSNDDKINIIQLGTNAANPCDIVGNALLKSFSIAKGIAITQGNSPVECLTVNALGMLMYPLGSSCINNFTLAFNIEKNNESIPVSLL